MSRKYKQPKGGRKPRPGVTRWTPLVLKVIADRKADLDALGIRTTVMAAAFLGIIHHESAGGNPEALSRSGDAGLTQLKLKGPKGEVYNTEADAYNPIRNLEIALDVTIRQLRNYDGDLGAALFARGWGRKNYENWVAGGGKPHWGAYLHRLFTEYYPGYSAWLAGWIQADTPQKPGTIRSKGVDYNLSLAIHEHGVKGKPFRAPYTGVFKASGKTRTYKKVRGSKNSAPAAPNPTGQPFDYSGVAVGASFAGAVPLTALVVSPGARRQAKVLWKIIKKKAFGSR